MIWWRGTDSNLIQLKWLCTARAPVLRNDMRKTIEQDHKTAWRDCKQRYDDRMDWEACGLALRAPGKMGGRPVIKGTRIEPETIIIDEEYGSTAEQTHASFPTLSLETILRVREFAHKHQLVP